MGKTFVYIAIITFGTIIAIQGLRLIRGKGQVNVKPLERVLMEVYGSKLPEKQLRILGRIRVVIGMFLVATGIWALIL